MKRFLILLAASAAALGSTAPEPVCSVGPDYLIPSNYELVRDSDAVVLAKAVRGIPYLDRIEQIVFDVLQVLKGTIEEKTLTFPGHDRWLGPSDPENFSIARPGAFRGACIAYDYKLQSQFVLVLRRDGKGWRMNGMPFTRVNEEVSGKDAPWTRAVVHYIRIAALKTVDEQKAALRALAVAAGDPVPGLAADIDRHFAQPHGSKPFEDLKRMYDLTSNEEMKNRVLWAFANGKHPAALDLIRDLIKSGAWTRQSGPVCAYVGRTKDASSVPALLDALAPDHRSLLPDSRWEVLGAVARAAEASHADRMLALLKTVTGEHTRPLLAYFVRHPSPPAVAELKRRIGKDFEEHTDLTFALAQMGDAEIVAWALTASKGTGERRWVSQYVLAISPREEADQAAQAILKGSDVDAIASLLQGYGKSRSPHRIERLLQGYAVRSRGPELETWVRASLRDLAHEGDAEAEAALLKLPDAKK